MHEVGTVHSRADSRGALFHVVGWQHRAAAVQAMATVRVADCGLPK